MDTIKNLFGSYGESRIKQDMEIKLPKTIWMYKIFLNLEISDLTNLSSTCKFLHQLSQDNFVWYKLYERDYMVENQEILNNEQIDWKKKYIETSTKGRIHFGRELIKKIYNDKKSFDPTMGLLMFIAIHYFLVALFGEVNKYDHMTCWPSFLGFVYDVIAEFLSNRTPQEKKDHSKFLKWIVNWKNRISCVTISFVFLYLTQIIIRIITFFYFFFYDK
eukprot:TRINITY_DN1811_c0_g1_i5.p1 TRINITY_DN1811_c0_g1~~TRINITY_DN1811_c0_g1_i5.p1  ORF type:complete len:218 (-),score=25.03 TRINITY_DN1811_c0_g1_i5:44-697(-)